MLENITPEQFMRTYNQACASSLPDDARIEKLILTLKRVAPILVTKRMLLQKDLQDAGVSSIESLRFAEETYLLAIYRTVESLLAPEDPFFANLEKQMKEE